MKKISAEQWMSLAAIIVSVCALFISIKEARLMKVQQRAMLYPHLDINPGYNEYGFKIRVRNSGAGIAMVKSVTVRKGDYYFTDWEEIADYFLPDSNQVGYNIIYTSNLNKKAILPGEEIEIFRVPWNDETRILVDSLDELSINIAYCSLLDDCWELSNNDDFPRKKKFKDKGLLQFK